MLPTSLTTLITEIVSRREKRRLRILVGDGIAAVSGIRRDSGWTNLEAVRMLTLKVRPDPAYFQLLQLVKHNAVDVIVTTNYDCFLDATFGRRSTIRTKINPVLDNNCFAHSSYCCSSTAGCSLRVWKIHGSLNAAFSPADGHIVKLPESPCFQIFKDDLWRYGAVGISTVRRNVRAKDKYPLLTLIQQLRR